MFPNFSGFRRVPELFWLPERVPELFRFPEHDAELFRFSERDAEFFRFPERVPKFFRFSEHIREQFPVSKMEQFRNMFWKWKLKFRFSDPYSVSITKNLIRNIGIPTVCTLLLFVNFETAEQKNYFNFYAT